MTEKQLSKALNGDEMMNLSNKKCKIVLYEDINKSKNIDELLGKEGCVFILYESKKHYGHWTLLMKRNNNIIEFFDSYNYKPDDQFEFIEEDFRELNNMMYPKLVELLYDASDRYKIHYNNYKFQSKLGNIATCGRWCIVRLWFKDINIDRFYKMIKYIKKKTGLSYDKIVVHLTEK